MPSSPRSRRIRWIAPVLVFGLIALIAAVPALSAGADTTPNLPPVTAQALLDKVQAVNLPGLSGTVQLSTNLGIPDLSALSTAVGGGGGFSPVSLLSGTHSADVWASKDGFKATYSDSPTSEDDIIANHTDLWTWQSQGTKVTHVVLLTDRSAAASPSTPEANSPVKTPDQVAQSVLTTLGPSTDVSVATPAYVADQPAYELVLAPKSGTPSTVDHIAVAVDANTGLPLRVQIFATGQSPGQPVLALDLGFTKISYGAPSPSTFTFTPPPGASVKTDVLPTHSQTAEPAGMAEPAASGSQPTVVGQDWTTVRVFHNVQLPPEVDRLLQRGSTTVAGSAPGRLFSTSLINVLVLDNGNVAVGAVTPAALEAAAASAG
jgi:outer membrane lipoprotein-sorting protein